MSLLHICFRDVAWLQAFPLNHHTVLDYLALSPFWDKSSTNDMLKMQQRHVQDSSNLPMAKQLEQMTAGVEFVVVGEYNSGTGSVITVLKRRRLRPGPAPSATVLLAVIVVLSDGNAYLVPSLMDVVNSRLSGALQSILQAARYGESVMVPEVVSMSNTDTDLVHPLQAMEMTQLSHLNAHFMSKIM